MASNSETGHAVNLSNKKKMIDFCTSFGAPYNPTNPRLAIAAMNAQWTAGDSAQTTLLGVLAAVKIPLNQRKLLFDPLDGIITRVNNAFSSMDVDDEIKKDVKGLCDEIRGKKKKATGPTPPDDPAGDPAGVSISHQSYVQKANHFKTLIELLTAAGYAPNETDINLTALNNMYNPMKAANDNIGVIIAPLKNAIITRDNALYTPKTGIVPVSREVKKYVKSAFGATSPQAKMVMALKFTNKKK